MASLPAIRHQIGAAAMALLLLHAAACATTRPASAPRGEVGNASYYAGEHHGGRTASGERYDMEAMTAAHRTLPFGTRARITNLENGRSVTVRINDRGPWTKGRILDLSYAAARRLGIIVSGVARIRIQVLAGAGADRESMNAWPVCEPAGRGPVREYPFSSLEASVSARVIVVPERVLRS
jgi:peptidoglycan lytic transglycosylase